MRVAAVLSGGGAKAAAHIGALRALREFKLLPSHYVGTSMGAVIAALHASGLEYDQVVERVTTLNRDDLASTSLSVVLGPFAKGLFRADKFKKTLSELIPAETFSDLITPLTVTAVDAATGELVLFGHGGKGGKEGKGGSGEVSLIEALYASCALPLYYPPAVIEGRQYVDGGLRSVLPIEVAVDGGSDFVFAVMVGPVLARRKRNSSLALIDSYNTAVRIMMAAQAENTIARWRNGASCDIVLVRPDVAGGATFEVEKAVSFIEEGYRAAYRELADSLNTM
ncbi:MAG: patatin-like phospholipase family protein [Gemmatimonadetes bacterium]|nr:patatin-like phospholipase family protein [Gemmatimonadota bacterium]